MNRAPVQVGPQGGGMPRGMGALVGTLVFAFLGPCLLALTGFMVAASLPGSRGETAGFGAMALMIMGFPAGAVVGFLVSFFGSPARILRRWMITAAVFAVLGGVLAYGMSAPGHGPAGSKAFSVGPHTARTA